jgi:hypothetical protein
MRQRIPVWVPLALIALLSNPVRSYRVSAGTDASWAYGINYAHATGLIFGRDLVFTYGPLAWLAAPMDVGRNLALGTAFQVACWAAFVALIAWVAFTRKIGPGRLLVFAVCLVAGRRSFQSFDYWGAELFLEFLALLLLGAAASETSRRRGDWLHAAAWAIGALLLLFKLNVGLGVIGAAALLSATFALRDRPRALRTAAMGVVGVPVVFVAAYWIYCGSVPAMLGYARGLVELTSGYNSAMTSGGDSVPLVLAFIVLLSWLALIVILYRLGDPIFPAAVACCAPLFLLFKHGFIREPLHVGLFFAFVPLLWGVVLLFGSFDQRSARRLIPPLIVVLPVICLATVAHTLTFRGTIYGPIEGDTLPAAITTAIGAAPVCIFPIELAYGPANHLNLQLLPVLQAYSAYTPYLDGLIAAYMEDSGRSPRQILFEWRSIDGRHPLLDVPAASLALYRNYQPEVVDSGYLVLRRLAVPRFGAPQLRETRELRLGRPFPVPPSQRRLIGRIHLQLTAWGTMRKFLFRIPEVSLSAATNRGVLKVRVPPDVMQDGIPLNFLPWDLDEARELLGGGMPATKVESLTIEGPGAAYLRAAASVEILEIP